MSYRIEWIAGIVPGAVLLLLIVPGFAVIGVLVVAAAALAALVALAAAVLASPYLLVRTVGRRRAEGRRPVERSVPTATVIARPATATNR